MSSVRKLLDNYGVSPRKRFGQNFLVRDGYIKAIARAADIDEGDTVLEIGAGIGNLTRKLALHADRVVAIEFDRDMLRVLDGELDAPNVEIIAADALKVDYKSIAPGVKMVAVANLPYNVATEIVFRLLDAREQFSRMLLMTQHEVARRFTADVGTKEYGILAVMTGLWAETKIEMVVPPSAFYPRPKVNSAVVRFDLLDRPVCEYGSHERFSKVVHAAFAQRRKMLVNSMSSYFSSRMEKNDVLRWIEKSGIDPKARAQVLEIKDFVALERNFPL